MNTTATTTLSPRLRRRTFFIVFAIVALVVAGVVSYAASSAPDGLDSATMRGCETSVVGGTEKLNGHCIAQSATDHRMASSPLADYSFGGIEFTNGLAGVVGVGVTLLVAGTAFWLISRRRRSDGESEPTDQVV